MKIHNKVHLSTPLPFNQALRLLTKLPVAVGPEQRAGGKKLKRL
jgi:hypothetical protein